MVSRRVRSEPSADSGSAALFQIRPHFPGCYCFGLSIESFSSGCIASPQGGKLVLILERAGGALAVVFIGAEY